MSACSRRSDELTHCPTASAAAIAAAWTPAARTTIYLLVVAKVFETREEAETWVAAWSGAKSSACEGLKSPSGGLPYAATGSVSNRPTSVSHSIDSAGIPAEREATSLAEWLSRSIPAPSRPSEPKQSG